MIAGLVVGLATAFIIAWTIPAIAIAFSTDYRFESQSYSLVFVQRYHDIALWVAPEWPDSAFVVAIILAPLFGGAAFHLIWPRRVLFTAIIFSICYPLAALFNVQMNEPVSFRWSRFFDADGRQLLTLFVLAAVMSALGASIVKRVGWAAKLREPDSDLGQPVFHSKAGAAGEFEATEIKNLLETNDIRALVTRDTSAPGMPFTVRVARKDIDRALILVKDFAVVGSAATETSGRE